MHPTARESRRRVLPGVPSVATQPADNSNTWGGVVNYRMCSAAQSGPNSMRLVLRPLGVEKQPVEYFEITTDERDRAQPTMVRRVVVDDYTIKAFRVLPLCAKKLAVVATYKRELKRGRVVWA